MAKNMVTVKYVDDNGDEWSMWADKVTVEVVGQGVKLGAVAADDSLPPAPRALKPRYAWFKGGTTNVYRRVVCYTKTCDAFTTAGTTLTMSPFRGTGVATETFTRSSKGYGEHFKGKKVDAPTIS